MKALNTVVALIVLLIVSVGFNIFQLIRSDAKPDSDASFLVAEMSGEKLYSDELARIDPEIKRAEDALFQSRRRAIDNWMAEIILTKEAEAQDLTTEQYLGALSEEIVVTVTEEEIDTAIQQFGDIYPDPTDPSKRIAVPRQEAQRYLEHMKRQQGLINVIEELKKKYPTKIHLTDSTQERIKENLAIKNRPSFGNPKAKAKIVIFTDFQCPFCKRLGLEVLPQIKELYQNKVYIVFRDFTMSYNVHAIDAAIAAKCADQQGKYMPYHDLLFENTPNLERAVLTRLAAEVNMDGAKFEICMNDPKVSDQVREDNDAAQKYNFTGTPVIVINGEVIQGAVPFHNLKEKIDALL